MSQQVFLIDGTLAENLRLGRPDATEAAIWQALQQAQLAEWVQTLPQRLNTLVGENGGLLSGGQRQRLAIARALLKQSPILILDEITSNLDVVNEAAIQRVISSLSGHCTLISIAHRLNTIAQADHIVVLQDGDIIEQGSPASLRLENGYYASLLQSQETTH
nr:ATP-binding cassette domain-containing protein [Pantoea rodasii]